MKSVRLHFHTAAEEGLSQLPYIEKKKYFNNKYYFLVLVVLIELCVPD